ncbi:MAG: serine/threonine-protein kinase, partial [Gemmatimonadota bacterium]
MIARLNAALEGRYRIERELGEGGMATVYLADDLRHARQVALKVLKPELAAVVGSDRFLAEIRTTAQLQHPHILPLHDSGEADGFLFYVMPYVAGESLRDRLDREKQLPVEEAVGIAVKVAGALQAAHDRGVVHRDIKPANIQLGRQGEPQVADFGIALALQEAGGGRLTETGLSLGTPYYMSPEQATADRDPDPRSDIYSLACVLYEMLTGDPPHTASTAQAVIAKILSQDPAPVREGRRSVPGHVEAALGMALQRLPADRFGSASDFAAALERRIEVASAGGGGGSRRGPARWLWPAVAAVLALVAVAGWIGRAPAATAFPPTHLAVPVPSMGGAATASFRQIGITPDGSTILYTALAPDGQNRTMRRRLDETESSVLPGVRPFISDYAISLDGREFVGRLPPRGTLYRYAIEGGSEQSLAVTLDGPYIAWDEDGGLWLSTGIGDQGLTRVDASGDTTLPFGDRFSDLIVNQVLPGGNAALAIRASRGVSSGPAVVIDLESESYDVLVPSDVVGVAYAAGCLVLVLPDGRMEAAAFDPKSRRLLGEPVTIANGVAVDQGVSQVAVAEIGTVAYIPAAPRSLVLVDREGRMRPATQE